MGINTVSIIVSSLQKIGEMENQKKFQEEIIGTLQSFSDQINAINHSQMEQISIAFTRLEWIQYGILAVLPILVSIFLYIQLRMLKRIKFLESKINQI